MNYDELYNQFLEDTEGENPELSLASFSQKQFITTLFETGQASCLPEHEYKMMETWLDYTSLTFKDASILIDRILQCQPNEAPIKEVKLATWIRKNKL